MAIKIRRGLDADRTSVIFEEGEVLYTTDTKSFFIGDGVTAGGNQIGGTTAAELLKTEVHNATGSTLTAGQVVYLSGNTGNKPNAVLAKADAEATSSKTIGLVIINIANNANGYIATDGLLGDLNTSMFAPGDLLWLSDSIAGGVTTIVPDTPNHAVFIGYVVAAHPTQGKILIHIQNGYELNELHDVKITSVANGESLTYSSSLGYWKNTLIDKTSIGLGNVTNVDTTNASNISSGTLSDSRLSTNVTTQGNTFNSANKLVQLDGTAKLPAVDGSQLTNLPTPSTPTLAQVTTAGNTTTNAISVGGLTSVGNVTASGAIARGVYFNNTLIAAANNDVLVGLDINPTFTNGAFTGVSNYALRVRGTTNTHFFSSGNIGVNTTTDAGYKLDVQGIGRFTGLLRGDSGFVGGGSTTTNTANARFWSNGGQAPTSGLYRTLYADISWIPTSGSAEWYGVDLRPTINQTGGANGITRGLYINPILTAAANWRSIEWSNSTGWGLYGAGAANNYLNGSLFVGTTTDSGFKLDVNGSTRLNGALTLGMTPIAAASVVSTHKLQITIAGTTYYLLASNI